jgi:hypothetical protein
MLKEAELFSEFPYPFSPQQITLIKNGHMWELHHTIKHFLSSAVMTAANGVTQFYQICVRINIP